MIKRSTPENPSSSRYAKSLIRLSSFPSTHLDIYDRITLSALFWRQRETDPGRKNPSARHFSLALAHLLRTMKACCVEANGPISGGFRCYLSVSKTFCGRDCALASAMLALPTGYLSTARGEIADGHALDAECKADSDAFRGMIDRLKTTDELRDLSRCIVIPGCATWAL